MSIGSRPRQLRFSSGMTQKQAAEKSVAAVLFVLLLVLTLCSSLLL